MVNMHLIIYSHLLVKKKTLPNQQYFQIFVGSAGFDLEVQTPVNENILQVYNM